MADSWKLRELARILAARDSDLLYGKLARLFEYAIEKAPDGDISGLCAKGLERRCNWDGRPGAFFEALFETEWIERRTDGSVHITGWMEHSGKLHLSRMADTRRKQIERKAPKKRVKSSANRVRRTSMDKIGQNTKTAPSDKIEPQTKLKPENSPPENVGKSTQKHVRRTSVGHPHDSDGRSYSLTASESGAVASSNPPRASAARAVCEPEAKRLPLLSPQKKSPPDSSAALPAAPTSTSAPNTTQPCSGKPMPSTHSFVEDPTHIQTPPTHTRASGNNSQSPARLFLPQHTSATVETPPDAEIVETRGMSQTRIEDALRTRWGKAVRANANTRTLLRRLLENFTVTEAMLDEARAEACVWHQRQGSEVHGTTIVQMLQTITHHQATAAQQQPSTQAPQGATCSGEAMFELPDGRTAGKAFYTAREQERARLADQADRDYALLQDWQAKFGAKR